MNIAVAVVNWNSGLALGACIESILAGSDTQVEVIVIDNASDDDSCERVLAFQDRVRFIRNPTNRGLAAAMNQAFAATANPYVLMLNPDVRVTPGAVVHLEKFMNAHPAAGAVGGYVNERYLPRKLPTLGALVRGNVGFPPADFHGDKREVCAVDQPAASAVLIRRKAFEDVGGFDEQFYPAWYEDVDFCCRLKAAGWEIYYAPQAEFLHEGGYSAKALGPSGFAEAYYRNQLRYAKKHFGAGAAIAVRCSIAVGMLARMAVQPGRLRAHWKTLLGALGQW